MKKKYLKTFIFLYLIIFSMLAQASEIEIYNSIKDITNPTTEDYKEIEKYLKNGDRKNLELLTKSSNPNEKFFRYDLRARKFHFISSNPNEKELKKTYIYNTDENDKDRCIITYCSFNGSYPKGIARIDKALKKIGYKGHFIAMIGGWPNLKNKGLLLSHMPYAFKPCFFEEVKSLGYKNVLWLDSAIIPLKNIDSVFNKIDKSGYFGYISSHKVLDYSNDYILKTFNLDKKEAEKILTIEAGIIGLNLKSDTGQKILTKWKISAENGGFYSSRPDQNSFSIIAYQLQLNNWDSPITRPHTLSGINEKSIFCVDHTFQDFH